MDSSEIDFLDVILDLQIYHPHRKPNAKEKHININFNNPPSVKNMIQNILSALSKNKTMSNNYKESYEKALKNSGFNKVSEYSYQNYGTAGRKKRKKQMLYYNPPFSATLKTEIGKSS